MRVKGATTFMRSSLDMISNHQDLTEVTAERVVLGCSDPAVEQEHLRRYEYALSFAKDKDILDVACGTGYGSAMMLEAGAKSVCGVDIDAFAVAKAETLYGRKGLSYFRCNAEKLDLPDRSFDVVVSFETIEHLQNPTLYLKEIHRVLRPGGLFLCSTPDRRLASTMYPIRRRPNNSFHVREYERGEFIEILSSKFSIVEMRGQAFVSSVLATWVIQISLKASCFALKRLGAYTLIRKLYHVGSGIDVQSDRPGIARFWVALCIREP